MFYRMSIISVRLICCQEERMLMVVISFAIPKKQFIRSGATSVGVNKRWKEHCAVSLLRQHNEHRDKIYCAYPASENEVSNNEIMNNKRGNFK